MRRGREAAAFRDLARPETPRSRIPVSPDMKVGIVVPFSWSFWGAVVEHAELQAAALEERGHDVRLIMGNDPPGQFTRVLHPRVGRHGEPPANVIPVGRSVIVPANGSLPNIVLSPRSYFRHPRARARALRRPPSARADDADDLPDDAHPRALPARRDLPRVRRPRLDEVRSVALGLPDRPDRSPHRRLRAREGVAGRWLPGEYEVIPNGVLVPDGAGGRPRAPHRLRRAAGAAERSAGAASRMAGDPPPDGAPAHGGGRRSARGAAAAHAPPCFRRGDRRRRLPEPGRADADAAPREGLVAPSIGQESFGMVLTRAFACALPVVASDIPGYREVLTPEARRGPAGRSGCARRRRLRARRGRAAPRGDGRGGARARGRALRVAGDRRAARGDLRGRDRNPRRGGAAA